MPLTFSCCALCAPRCVLCLRYGHEGAHFLSKRTMAWFSAQYCPDRALVHTARMSPLCAESLSGLPPALVLVAEHDVLKDEGVAYARQLAKAGCAVTLRGYQRVPHGFLSMRLMFPTQHDVAVADIAQFLRFRATLRELGYHPHGANGDDTEA